MTTALTTWLADIGWWTATVWLGRLIGVCLIPSVLMRRSTRPIAAVAWILGLLFVPYLGAFLWWLMGRNHLRHRQRPADTAKRSQRRLDSQQVAPGDSDVPDSLQPTSFALDLNSDPGLAAPSTEDTVAFYPSADDAYNAFERAIKSADDHIHFQFYTWRADETGTRFRDLLADCARRGVEVRALYDAVGSVSLPKRFLAPLIDAGARVEPFSPVRLWERRLRINFRNHRKILVVDGRCAFTGGVNIADEYRQWLDTAYGFRGPVVYQMQEAFADDWQRTTGDDLSGQRYFPALPGRSTTAPPLQSPVDLQADGDMTFDVDAQLVCGGPDDRFQNIQKAFFGAINAADDRLFSITPYFVPDQAMFTALQAAALRGVDVRIVVPARSDVPLTQHAGRAFWEPLLEAGVRIYEYQGTVLHAKLLLLDDAHVIAGSANMDLRSFELNFEASALIRGTVFNRRMIDFFFEILGDSEEVDLPSFRNRPRKARLKEGVARLFSPLL